MSASGWVHLNVTEIIGETDKALKLLLDEGEEIWVPRSVVCDADDYALGDQELTISVARWFAEKEGLEDGC